MANVERAKHVQDGKEAASRTASALLLRRHPTTRSKGEAAQDLQELYQVPKRDVSSGMGAYWLKFVGGTKVQGDETLARVAHEAVLLGKISPSDYPLLKLFPGGLRLLQMVGHLLIESHGGSPLDELKVMQSLAAWNQALARVEDLRSKERRKLWVALDTARKAAASAVRSVHERGGAPALQSFLETQCCARKRAVCDVEAAAPQDLLSQTEDRLLAHRAKLDAAIKRLVKSAAQVSRAAGATSQAGVVRQDSSIAEASVTSETGRTPLAELRAINQKVGTALRAVDRLRRKAKASKFFDLQCSPEERGSSEGDEAQDTRPDTSSSGEPDSLQAAILALQQRLSWTRAEEKYSAGFADLPSITPQGPSVSASLDFMHQQVLDIVAIEWEDDPEDVEIVAEDLGDCFEPLEADTAPVPLVWVRRTDARLSTGGL
jgi:hypothetical protein